MIRDRLVADIPWVKYAVNLSVTWKTWT